MALRVASLREPAAGMINDQIPMTNALNSTLVIGPFLKWRVRGSHPAVVAYEASMGAGPPALIQIRNAKFEIPKCAGQELNLHSHGGWFTATWARPCPADACFVEHSLRECGLSTRGASRLLLSVPDGI